MNASRTGRVAIFYHADPVGNIPGGIDTVVRSVLEHAPPDLSYTLYGATTDAIERPVDSDMAFAADGRSRFVPLVSADPNAVRHAIPLSLRYMRRLRQYLRTGRLRDADVMDFHRIEPVALMTGDWRPKNLMLHQDMSILRSPDCDIGWRRAPWLYEWLEGRLFPHLQRIFCVRQSAVERYRRTYPGLAERFTFTPTSVDTIAFHPAENAAHVSALRRALASEHGMSLEGPLLVFVGRLDKQKDPLLLLDAAHLARQAYPDMRVLLVGDGILRPAVEAHITARGLQQHVRLLGRRLPGQVAELLRAADLFVLSSAYEGMPIAVLEALASGVPVVTTAVGEVARVVHDKRNGAIVRDHTPRALAEGIIDVLSNRAVLRGRPATEAVAPYTPARVLSCIYDNHRAQLAAATRVPRGA